MSRVKVVAVGVMLALVSVTSAWAQTVSSTTGAINGKATDETGAALPGVTVTAVSESMQGSRTTVTGEDGTLSDSRRFRPAPTSSPSSSAASAPSSARA